MANKELIEKIRQFVEDECKKPDAKYSTAYELHFVSMHKIAKKLAEKLNADVEVVEIAAWLHDIGSIVYGRKSHHITGAIIAEEKLRSLNYPEEKTQRVKKCILNHRGSKENENRRELIEEKIIAEADVLDSFNDISKQFLITLVHEKKPLEEAKKSIVNKLKNKWNQLEFEESKELIKPKFDAVMLLFGEENDK